MYHNDLAINYTWKIISLFLNVLDFSRHVKSSPGGERFVKKKKLFVKYLHLNSGRTFLACRGETPEGHAFALISFNWALFFFFFLLFFRFFFLQIQKEIPVAATSAKADIFMLSFGRLTTFRRLAMSSRRFTIIYDDSATDWFCFRAKGSRKCSFVRTNCLLSAPLRTHTWFSLLFFWHLQTCPFVKIQYNKLKWFFAITIFIILSILDHFSLSFSVSLKITLL